MPTFETHSAHSPAPKAYRASQNLGPSCPDGATLQPAQHRSGGRSRSYAGCLSHQLPRQLETPPDPQRGKIWDARLAEKELHHTTASARATAVLKRALLSTACGSGSNISWRTMGDGEKECLQDRLTPTMPAPDSGREAAGGGCGWARGSPQEPLSWNHPHPPGGHGGISPLQGASWRPKIPRNAPKP